MHVAYGSAAQRHLDLLEVVDGTPALADEALLRHVQVEHVQRVIDRLDLAHLDEPLLDVLGGRHEHTVTVVLRLTQHLARTHIGGYREGGQTGHGPHPPNLPPKSSRRGRLVSLECKKTFLPRRRSLQRSPSAPKCDFFTRMLFKDVY